MFQEKKHDWTRLFLKSLVVIAIVVMFFIFEFVLNGLYLFYVLVIIAIVIIIANRFANLKLKKQRKNQEPANAGTPG